MSMAGREARGHRRTDRRARAGHGYPEIECPFCGVRVTTSYATLAWSGKACPGCGAKHGFLGQSWAPTERSAAYAARRRSQGGIVADRLRIEWQDLDSGARLGVDGEGNRYCESASRETVSVRLPDGRAAMGWTAEEALRNAKMARRECALGTSVNGDSVYSRGSEV